MKNGVGIVPVQVVTHQLLDQIGRAQSIFEVSPKSKGALAYQRLIQEMGL